MSAAEQREAFQEALTQSLEEAFSVEVVRTIHESLTDRMTRHKEEKDPEPLTVTVGELEGILRDCGVPQERIGAFQGECEERFGAGAECTYLMETRIIDGKRYILIPAEDAVEVNGQTVRLLTETQ